VPPRVKAPIKSTRWGRHPCLPLDSLPEIGLKDSEFDLSKPQLREQSESVFQYSKSTGFPPLTTRSFSLRSRAAGAKNPFLHEAPR